MNFTAEGQAILENDCADPGTAADDHAGDDDAGDDHAGDDHAGDDHAGDDHAGDDGASVPPGARCSGCCRVRAGAAAAVTVVPRVTG